MIKKLPKLLDFIKDLGMTHEEAMTALTELKKKPDTEIEEPVEKVEPTIEEPTKKVPLRTITTDERDVEIAAEKAQEEEEEVEEDTEPITLTKEELAKKIEDAVADKLKSDRKTPSKGNINDKPQTNIAMIKRNWYEVIV